MLRATVSPFGLESGAHVPEGFPGNYARARRSHNTTRNDENLTIDEVARATLQLFAGRDHSPAMNADNPPAA